MTKSITKLERSFYESDLIGGDKPRLEAIPATELPTTGSSARTRSAKAMLLAREYVKDYDLQSAANRMDMEYEEAARMYNTPVFSKALRACIEIIAPDEVITSREILQGYKRIAFDPAAPHAARITALDKLNRFIVGMKPKDGLDEEGKLKNAVPVINITLATNGTDTRPKFALPAEPSISIDSD